MRFVDMVRYWAIQIQQRRALQRDNPLEGVLVEALA